MCNRLWHHRQEHKAITIGEFFNKTICITLALNNITICKKIYNDPNRQLLVKIKDG
jgi:hypothetical protein